ncbi:MAG TPA: DUF2071 domain-containing protein [Candidatus Acidoferrales bacterium]|nr:DUF2071 domain-containing protein [Candidatus Acidoferrales bacterium]
MLAADRTAPKGNIFLAAEWRDLAMLNYQVSPKLLEPYVPHGTELDSFNGKTFVSLVGFRFLNTKLFGVLPIPFHTDFDEVNLRFYVRRSDAGANKRGVVFIREIVPKRAIALVARLAYGENYVALPMKHEIETGGSAVTTDYQWKLHGRWCRLHAQASEASVQPEEGSLEQFITEHYWGYTVQRDGGCKEYRVEHVPWRVWRTKAARVDGDCEALYGAELSQALKQQPDSAFIADGSPVRVLHGRRIS